MTGRRNRNYFETHQHLLTTARAMIADSGADGVSLCALARVTGINRSTIYFHFANREDLMAQAAIVDPHAAIDAAIRLLSANGFQVVREGVGA